MGVVGRTGECEADGHGRLVEPVDDGRKALHERVYASVQPRGPGGKSERRNDFLVSFQGAEHEIGPARVEGDDDSVVVAVHDYLVVFAVNEKVTR